MITEETIIEFIKDNPNTDSVDLVKEFGPNVAFPLLHLQSKKIIRKEYCGIKSRYVINN